MRETWRDIPDFPGYAVSHEGRVLNENRDHLMTPMVNQQGVVYVGMYAGGRQHRRGVALLVANAFLPPPDDPEHFDTPINLDGDRFNNHVDNLAWRPRWFAIQYHQQLKRPVIYGFNGAIEVLETGEVFNHIRELSTKYGLLEKEAIYAATNHTPIFPTWHTLQLVQ